MANTISVSEIRCLGVGLSNKLCECERNNLASSYIENHYNQLAEEVIRMGTKYGMDPEMRYDVLNDVYGRILEKETNGYCFNPNIKGGYINVEDYVRGMLSKYSRNKAYRKLNRDVDVSYNDNIEIPADGYLDTNSPTPIQIQYGNASTYSDLEELDNKISLVQEIELLLSFDSQLKMNMRIFIKNLREIAEISKNINKSLFEEIRTLTKINYEFGEALKSLITFAKNNPVEYEELVAAL
jgi:hypothetical protein